METRTRGKGTIDHGLRGSMGTLDDMNPTRLSKRSQAVPLQKGRSATWTERLYLQSTPSWSSVLLCTTRWGQYQPAICKTWWQSGFGCLIRDLVKISPPVSGDPYNLHWRPGLGSCPDSRPPSNFLGGRKFLLKHWLRLLLRLQRRSAARIVVQILPRFEWGKH